MKLWISKGGTSSIQEQLSAQIVLGIVSGDLAPRERLPSTVEIARRFQIHANTVRAVYRDLAKRRWVEWKRGSGFFVRPRSSEEATLDPELDLDRLISAFLDVARSRGHSLAEIQSRMNRWFQSGKPDHIVVIEPEAELREIIVAEISDQISARVVGAQMDDCGKPGKLTGAFCVALYDHAEEVRAALSPETPCLFLPSRSAPKTIAGQNRPGPETLITVVSRWPSFLKWAQILLVAVGLDATAIDLRDARRKGWQRGLTPKSFIITDSLQSRVLPKGPGIHVFSVISDESIDELRQECRNIW